MTMARKIYPYSLDRKDAKVAEKRARAAEARLKEIKQELLASDKLKVG